jgi:uncharacterized transporter YbjL
MKRYGALRAIPGIFKFIGWATIGLAIFFFVIGFAVNTNNFSTPFGRGADVTVVAFLIMLATVLCGIFIVASGELIDAVVDIATNTAHLPAIAQSSERTVGFFDHMSAKATGSAQQRPEDRAAMRPAT